MLLKHSNYGNKSIIFQQKGTSDLRIVIKNNCFMYKKLCLTIKNCI